MNRKRIRWLLRKMSLVAAAPTPDTKTSWPGGDTTIFEKPNCWLSNNSAGYRCCRVVDKGVSFLRFWYRCRVSFFAESADPLHW